MSQGLVVTRFESEMLLALEVILKARPVQVLLQTLRHVRPCPSCFHRGGIAGIEDRLRKGVVQRLAKEGGYVQASYLRGENLTWGRVWQRTAPEELGLSLSRHSLEWLAWLAASHPEDEANWPPFRVEQLTLGDRLLLIWTYEAVRESDYGKAFRRLPFLVAEPFCQLAYADDFLKENESPFDFSSWMTTAGQAILEVYQSRLAQNWLAMEQRKVRIVAWQRLQSLGRQQLQLLTDYFTAIAGAGRRDLARFYLHFVRDLFRQPRELVQWTGGLDAAGTTLSERANTYRLAIAPLQAWQQVFAWQEAAQEVSYFEEEYALSQAWKLLWEEYQAEQLTLQVTALLHEARPF
ncbi:Hypothetical protein PBC10988_18390 [Planctomycetales bacterium 10988]|nr:Hypothetical protein PBC10988_18390 [Planctomycetales bacterium 10988]